MFRHSCIGIVLIGSVLQLVASATLAAESKPATAATIEAQRNMLAALPREDGRDEKWARQGFIATLDDPVTRRADGGVVRARGQPAAGDSDRFACA